MADEEKTENGKDRDELAEDRTELSEDRTLLATERTYAGWMRTGLGCVGVALGFRAMLRQFEPAWLPKLVATAFILAGTAIIWFAWRHACHVLERLDNHAVGAMPLSKMGWLSGTMIAASLTLGVVLWMI